MLVKTLGGLLGVSLAGSALLALEVINVFMRRMASFWVLATVESVRESAARV